MIQTCFPHKLRIPAVAAPMFLVSGPDLVLAACRAGIACAFPTLNARTAADLDGWMARITEGLAAARAADPTAIVGPWAVNLITHSSNRRLPGDLELVARHKPPVVVTALGSPKPAIEAVRGYGGLVLADVIDLGFARKAAAAGADGLVLVAAGAGGHTGALSPFAFVSAVREFFDGILVLGGGIATGAGIAGAIAAGADLAYVGTRFIASAESIAAEAHKRMVVAARIEDLLLSRAITGATGSWLKPSLVAAGLDPSALPPPDNLQVSGGGIKKRWSEIFSAGQGLGSVSGIEPARDIIDRLAREFDEASRRLCKV